MDKSFFSFDIDDEVIKTAEAEKKKKAEEKKSAEFDFSTIFASKKLKVNENKTFVKNNGLAEKKKVNSKFSAVNDYCDFDFRAKAEANKTQNNEEQISDELKALLESEEVKIVINKSRIGVMFY